jgi:voltage-gated potassium channel
MERSKELSRQRDSLLQRITLFLEGPMIFLGFVWLVLLVVELIYGLTPAMEMLSMVIWIIFIIDFLIKFILAPDKTKFFKQQWLTAISLVVPALRVVRFVRFVRAARGLRSLRLIKVVGSLNRGMKSLSATMRRRGVNYVIILTLVVIFSGAAGMHAFEKGYGLKNYWESLWWTAMLITSIGSEYWPQTGEGKVLSLILSIYGFCVFGYITASLASFFVGRDAEEKDAPLAGSKEIIKLQREIRQLTEAINELRVTTRKQ